MKKFMILALAGFLACGPGQGELERVRQEAAQTSAERDSLVAEVLATASMVNEINLELARVTDSGPAMALPGETGASAAEANEVALERIRAAINQLQTTQAQLDSSRTRISQLSSNESRLVSQINRYQETITELREQAEKRETELQAVIQQQRAMITTLASAVDTARAENQRLNSRNVMLTDSVSHLTTVYYAVGTKSELEERGIVVNEGTKFLFFGSKTLQPARDLNPEDFTAIDMHDVMQIPLPDSTKEYKILTRQNPEFLAAHITDDGKVRGDALAITSPRDFWAASRFLILVQN